MKLVLIINTLRKYEKKFNYDVIGYFEDYTIYGPHLDKIRNWFQKLKKKF